MYYVEMLSAGCIPLKEGNKKGNDDLTFSYSEAAAAGQKLALAQLTNYWQVSCVYVLQVASGDKSQMDA
jgi:hypothetical protein